MDSDAAQTTYDIDFIGDQIRMLDRAEARGEDVTEARAYWRKKATDWAKPRLGSGPKRSEGEERKGYLSGQERRSDVNGEERTKCVIDGFLQAIFKGFTREDVEFVQRTCSRGPLEHPAKKPARVAADMLSTFSTLPTDKEADEASRAASD